MGRWRLPIHRCFDELYFIQNATGAVLDPVSSFLVARGLKTLDLRVRAQSETALQVGELAATAPASQRGPVPRTAVASATRAGGPELFDGGFGAMVTFELDGSIEQTAKVCESTELFHLAVSLGAVESLIEQPATMSHASYDAADRAKFGISDGLIRLSVGLESPEDLQADLEQAIAAT